MSDELSREVGELSVTIKNIARQIDEMQADVKINSSKLSHLTRQIETKITPELDRLGKTVEPLPQLARDRDLFLSTASGLVWITSVVWAVMIYGPNHLWEWINSFRVK